MALLDVCLQQPVTVALPGPGQGSAFSLHEEVVEPQRVLLRQ